MKRSTAFLLGFALFFLGIVVGFLVSPVKNGIEAHDHTTNNYYPSDEGESDEAIG